MNKSLLWYFIELNLNLQRDIASKKLFIIKQDGIKPKYKLL